MLAFKDIKVNDIEYYGYDHNEIDNILAEEIFNQFEEELNEAAHKLNEDMRESAPKNILTAFLYLKLAYGINEEDPLAEKLLEEGIIYSPEDITLDFGMLFFTIYHKLIDPLTDKTECEIFINSLTIEDLKTFNVSQKNIIELQEDGTKYGICIEDIVEKFGIFTVINLYQKYRKNKNSKNTVPFTLRVKDSENIKERKILRLPILKNYQHSLYFSNEDKTHIHLLKNIDHFTFEGNNIFHKDNQLSPLTSEQLDQYTNYEEMYKINIILLIALFNIIYNNIEKRIKNLTYIEENTWFQLPLSNITKFFHINTNDKRFTEKITQEINDFKNLIGIIKSKDNENLFFRVFILNKNDENEIIFSSPYFMRLIKDIYEKSHDRNGKNTARAYSSFINPEAGRISTRKNDRNPFIYNAIAIITTFEIKRQQSNTNGSVTISIGEIMKNNLIFQQYIQKNENKKRSHLYEHLRNLFQQTMETLTDYFNLDEDFIIPELYTISNNLSNKNWKETQITFKKRP